MLSDQRVVWKPARLEAPRDPSTSMGMGALAEHAVARERIAAGRRPVQFTRLFAVRQISKMSPAPAVLCRNIHTKPPQARLDS